ncbi:MAG: DUF11 domain-containing protein, partial [Actinomycetia bacterium]|nr:DUF11 domain-containing protein [Actinomycetes bacterium]
TTLTDLTVTDPLPGLSAVSCATTSLAPTETVTCTATYSVTQTDVDAGQISSTGTAAGSAPNGAGVVATDIHAAPIDRTPGLALTKVITDNDDADGSGGVSLADTVTYTFVATNTGNVTLTATAISDPLPGITALACVPAAGGALAPGATQTCTASYVVTQANVDSGTIDNTATAGGSAPDGTGVVATASSSQPIDRAPALTFAKSVTNNDDADGSDDVSLGDTVTYGFGVTNTGNVTLTNIAVTDPLPGLSTVLCASTALLPGGTTTCTATYVVTQADVDAGAIDNTASVTAEDPDGTTLAGNDAVSTPVPQTPILVLVKSIENNADEDGSDDVTTNDTLEYGYVITNTGNVTLTNLDLDDPSIINGSLTCTPPLGATLLPGDSAVCTATYSVTQADVDAGVIANSATAVADDPNGQPVDSTSATSITAAQVPAIDLVKSLGTNADQDGSGTVSRGDTLTWDYNVTNTGNVTLVDIAVTDPHPDFSAVACGTTTLPPGGTVTCTASYVVTQADVDAGIIQGPSSAEGDSVTGLVFATSSAGTPVPQSPVLGVAKAVSGVVNHGTGSYTVTWILTVENLGNVTLADVGLTDDVATLFAAMSPTGFTIIDGSLTANPTWDGTAASPILAPGQQLLVGESGTVSIIFTVTPGATTAGTNQAVGTGIAPDGSPVTDLSTSGLDTDPDGNGVPDEGDPTPIDFAEAPAIGVAKATVDGPNSLGDGRFDLVWVMVIENDGDVTLDDLRITDDLSATFADALSFDITELSSPDFTVNTDYDGTTDTNLVAAGNSLAAGARGTIRVGVVVVPGDDLGPYLNQAVASGLSPTGTAVADLSDWGSDPDDDGDGSATDDNDPTEFSFPAVGDIAGTVWLDEDGDGEQDPDEPELPGAYVTLICAGIDGLLGTADDVEVASVIADPHYLFEDVLSGACEIVIDLSTADGDLIQTVDPDGTGDSRTVVTVVAGKIVSRLDFGYALPHDLAITKSGPGSVSSGANVPWTITLTNQGQGLAPGPIVITDNLPSSLALVSTEADGWSCSTVGQTLTCGREADLDIGASATIELVTRLTPGATLVANEAVVTGADPDNDADPSNDRDSDTVSVTGGVLAFTGAETSFLLLGAAALIVLGGGFMLGARLGRRERDEVEIYGV